MTYKSDFNCNLLEYNPKVIDDSATILFENLPELIIPQVAAKFLNKSVKTLYDWNDRGKTRKRTNSIRFVHESRRQSLHKKRCPL
jgi:hypothetical protein